MITSLFAAQLAVTFIVGGLWIFLTVLAGSHFGSKIGGFIGGLPSTALLSFFFIGYTQSPELAARATTVFPLAVGVSGVFLVVYASVSRLGFLPALSVSLLVWCALSYLILVLHPERFGLILLVYAVVMVCAFHILENILSVRSVKNVATHAALRHMAIRSVFGGLVIMLTVLLAKLAGPFVGGILAAFPAMFIATLTITYQTQGIAYSRALTKPLLVTGMITVAGYAIGVRYLYPAAGLYLGTILSMLIASICAYFTLTVILRRLT